jgi:CRP-like cAMP-binding protein
MPMTDDPEIRAVLGAIPLFSETLNERQLDQLAGQCRVAVFPAGALLMAEGDFAEAMFAIIDGEVSVTLHDRRGDEHGVATLKAGDIVGEMALLTGMRRQATVSARTDIIAVEITKATIEGMFARAPDLIDSFGTVLMARQAELDRITADADAEDEDIVTRIRRFFGGR